MDSNITLPSDKAAMQREYFSWLTKREMAKKPIISSAIDAIYDVYTGKYTTQDVDDLKQALTLNHMYSYAFAEYVHDFAKTDSVFEALLLELAQHSSATVRFNVVTNCLYNYPAELIDFILVQLLDDKSKRVRLKVPDVMGRLNKEHLLPPLLERIQIEPDTEVKKAMQWTYDLLHKKWVLEPDGEHVTVHLKSGGVSGFSLSCLSDDSLQAIEKEVEKIRREWG